MANSLIRRPLWMVSLCVFATLLTARSQESAAEPTFVFDTGNPPWRGERIELPPGFAPDLGWKGVEQIRFAPGMFTAGEEDFFSYVLVFLLSKEAKTDKPTLERELLTYYRGLSNAVMGGKGQSVETEGFTIALEVIADAKNAPTSAKDVTAFTGTLNWVEPFATQKEQTLNLEIFVWKHGDQPVVFSSVSPADPGQETPWKNLRAIATKFLFEP